MANRHDRSSESFAPQSGTEPLSDVLRTVRLTGALFFLTEASSPWVFEIPDARAFAPIILPGAQQVVSYHIIRKGTCTAGLRDGGSPVALCEGDIVLFPHGDAYFMSCDPGVRGGDPLETLGFFREMAARRPFVVAEGGGGSDETHFVCGFLGCDVRPFNPVLATLPRLVHMRKPAGPEPDRLTALIDFALAESRDRQSGGECVLLRLSELMFVEVVRRYLATLPAEQTGWLAGLRDPVVGHALTLLHESPGDRWTLEALAREVGLSRSVLADRFAHYVGQPPMQYLARWRMQVAARLLADGASKVCSVALDVGYDSEAAFSRAFKKIVGTSPGAWRRRVSEA